MTDNPVRFIVRPATDRPGWEVWDRKTESAYAVRATRNEAIDKADELNARHAA